MRGIANHFTCQISLYAYRINRLPISI
uniref:Uncharacterized protein n=1 Tax=Anguilla anguilla TaxID=7936 RepID=A0A0E9V372_ANGAN